MHPTTNSYEQLVSLVHLHVLPPLNYQEIHADLTRDQLRFVLLLLATEWVVANRKQNQEKKAVQA